MYTKCFCVQNFNSSQNYYKMGEKSLMEISRSRCSPSKRGSEFDNNYCNCIFNRYKKYFEEKHHLKGIKSQNID